MEIPAPPQHAVRPTFAILIAIFVAPIVLAIRLRPLGLWTAVTGGAVASGVVLVFGLPVALLAPKAVGVLVLTLAIVGTVVAPAPSSSNADVDLLRHAATGRRAARLVVFA